MAGSSLKSYDLNESEYSENAYTILSGFKLLLILLRRSLGLFLFASRKAFHHGDRERLQLLTRSFDIASKYLYEMRKKHSTLRFTFMGQEYQYECSTYNNSTFNERTVEIPIFRKVIRDFAGKQVLEIGNVLSHYSQVRHTVVDKYEKAKGVLNKDVVDFETEIRFDLIVSISTLEHVGLDEPEKDDRKLPWALDRLRSLLKEEGYLMISVPIGYNPGIDNLAFNEVNYLKSKKFMKRLNFENEWKECSVEDAKGVTYDSPFPNANAIMILTLQK